MPIGDIRPVPDPTVLTTELTHREIRALREIIEARLFAMDKATELRDTSVRDTIQHVIEITDQKFIRIDQQFVERDKRTDQLTAASATAVAAALQAQKEAAGEQTKSSAAAIAKSENSTSESIKQLQILFQTSIAGLSAQILEVKSRLDKGEGQGAGLRQEKDDSRNSNLDSRSFIFSVLGMAIGIAAIVVTVLARVVK